MSNQSVSDTQELAELPGIPWVLFAASAYRVRCMLIREEAVPFDKLSPLDQQAWETIVRHLVTVLGGQVTYAMNPDLLTELEQSWCHEPNADR